MVLPMLEPADLRLATMGFCSFWMLMVRDLAMNLEYDHFAHHLTYACESPVSYFNSDGFYFEQIQCDK